MGNTVTRQLFGSLYAATLACMGQFKQTCEMITLESTGFYTLRAKTKVSYLTKLFEVSYYPTGEMVDISRTKKQAASFVI